MDLTAFFNKPVPEVMEEPKPNRELSDDDLGVILEWYFNNQSQKDSDQYVLDYMRYTYNLDLVVPYNRRHTKRFGFLCRIMMNGSILPDEESIAFDKMSFEVRTIYKTNSRKAKPIPKDSIIDKANDFIYLFDDALEQFVASGFNIKGYFNYLPFETLKGVHARYVIESLSKLRDDFIGALTTNDDDLKEAYGHFTKPQMKKIIGCYDDVILKCEGIVGVSKVNRKPRKRKKKSAEELVGKVKVCREFNELELKSIEPTLIIGAQQVWVYDTKYKKLGLYLAKDSAGFTVKGTTILEFDEIKSTQKIVRKPKEVLTEVKNGGKDIINKVLLSLKTKEQKLTGRLNENVLLLRVI